MKQRWIFGGLLVIAVGVIVAVAIWGPDRDWGPRDNRVEVVQIVDDRGAEVDGARTIIVERDRHFFPLGLLLIPLLLVLLIGLFRRTFWGPPGAGPWGHGGGDRAQWLDEWHARQHQEMASTAKPSSTESS